MCIFNIPIGVDKLLNFNHVNSQICLHFRLFVVPLYDGLLLEQSLLYNRNRADKSEVAHTVQVKSEHMALGVNRPVIMFGLSYKLSLLRLFLVFIFPCKKFGVLSPPGF